MCDLESLEKLQSGLTPIAVYDIHHIPYAGSYTFEQLKELNIINGFYWVVASGSGFELIINSNRIPSKDYFVSWS